MATHFHYMCEHSKECNKVLVSAAALAIDTQPGDDGWKMEGLGVERRAFQSLQLTASHENHPSALRVAQCSGCLVCQGCRSTPELQACGVTLC